ncbi:hypothetical protein [Halalkalibaculum sp. DA3122]|uniref:hypothetical protein n=1 Tax=Halalkalibaculum sp. DA3122 TaxID=3373607 RepID=UPI003754E7F2
MRDRYGYGIAFIEYVGIGKRLISKTAFPFFTGRFCIEAKQVSTGQRQRAQTPPTVNEIGNIQKNVRDEFDLSWKVQYLPGVATCKIHKNKHLWLIKWAIKNNMMPHLSRNIKR